MIVNRLSTGLPLTSASPWAACRLAATYRRGDELVTQVFDIPLQVLQQSRCLEALRFITNDYTPRPDVSPPVIPEL